MHQYEYCWLAVRCNGLSIKGGKLLADGPYDMLGKIFTLVLEERKATAGGPVLSIKVTISEDLAKIEFQDSRRGDCFQVWPYIPTTIPTCAPEAHGHKPVAVAAFKGDGGKEDGSK